MKFNKYIFFLSFCALIIIGVSIFNKVKNQPSSSNFLSNQPLSSDILFLTKPVNSFTGIVEKLEKNSITLTQNVSFLAPTPINKTINRRFEINDNTQIGIQPSTIQTLAITPAPTSTLSINNLHKGEIVTVITDQDLRIDRTKFIAQTIALHQLDTIIGKITKINNNKISVIAKPIISPILNSYKTNLNLDELFSEKQYAVELTENTEIFRIERIAPNAAPENISQPQPTKLNIIDLKPDMQVVIFTAENITVTKELKALRIESIF